eukprot:2593845-Pleurochrysis_carterae.AAC.2
MGRLHPIPPVLHSDASAEGRVAMTAAHPSGAPALPSVLLLPPRGALRCGHVLQFRWAQLVSAE